MKRNMHHLFTSPLVILLSIVAYEVMKINLQVIFKESADEVILFDNSWLLASVIGSTLLGFFSDRYFRISWRKPICLIGLFFSLITGVAFLHPALHDFSNTYLILFFIILNGLSASYVGAARAFYLDQFKKDKLFHFAITVVFQCIPWVMLGWFLMEDMIDHTALHYFSIFFVAIIFLANYYLARDVRSPDSESRHGLKELRVLARKYNYLKEWSIVLSFFLLAVSYHLMPYLGAYTFLEEAFYREIFILGLGVGIGVPLVFLFIKIPTLKALQFGYALCFLYFVALAIINQYSLIDTEKTLKYQFLIFAILGGTLWILSIKEFLIKSSQNENGFVLGFIESIQSLGELVAAFLSTLLTVATIAKQTINLPIFLILLAPAFILVSLEGVLRKLRN